MTDDERAKLIEATKAALPADWTDAVAREAIGRAMDSVTSQAPKIATDAIAAALRAKLDQLLQAPDAQKTIDAAGNAAVSAMLAKLRG